jgi:hypothetical protein
MSEFKIGSTVKVSHQPSEIKEKIIGWKGVVVEYKGIIENGHLYEINMYMPPIDINDPFPFGSAVINSVNLEICYDEDISKVSKSYTEYINTKSESMEEKIKRVDEGLKILSNKYGITVEQLRTIFDEVSELLG